MEDIVILGNGGFAKEVAFLIDSINAVEKKWNILGYIAKDDSDIGKQHGKYPVFNSDNWLGNINRPVSAVFGLGSPELTAKIFLGLNNNRNIHFPNLIHPNVVADWNLIKIGEGNIICAGNILTIDIEIGSHNIFNLGCTVGHDTIIGNYNVFNPSVNISGGILLGNKNLVGTGAQILQFLNICDNNKIGAGAVVTKNIDESGTYVGMPAKKIS
jgi:sugar O-acyltransferase (sialic acid O-acetyltransferase NeuD family)